MARRMLGVAAMLRATLKLGACPFFVVVPAAIAILGVESGWALRFTDKRPLADLILYFAVVVPAVTAIFILERVIPYRREWNRPQGDVLTDIVHMTTGWGVYQLLRPAVSGAVALAVSRVFAASSPSAFWPESAPLAVQLFLALLIGELGHYWYHRLAHETPLLWRLHATHHSPRRLYWLNANRFHWLDITLLYIAQYGPLFALGCSSDLFLVYGVYTIVFGYLQHANVDFTTGFLDYVFSTPALHRYHHSTVLEEGNSNYAGDLVIWDQLFNSFHRPSGRPFDGTPGIGGMPNFPKGFVAQQLSPFRWRRVEAESRGP